MNEEFLLLPSHTHTHIHIPPRSLTEEVRVNGLAEPAPKEPTPEPVSIVIISANTDRIHFRMA